jgi:serine protease Do
LKTFETRWERLFPYILGALFGLSVALLVVSIIMFQRTGERQPLRPYTDGIAGSERIDAERKGAIASATRRVSPAVVSITTLRTTVVQSNPFYQYLRLFYPSWRFPSQYEQQSSNFGSGVVVGPEGYIISNEHVVRSAEKIYVTLNDGTELEASLVGSSAAFDLALLKVETTDLPYAQLGDSDSLVIGEWVIAIGSPFGYLLNDTQPTVTVGVVSALNRDVKSDSETEGIFTNMIQTDAAINPGNSGGPLVSSTGEIIGINTFIFSSGSGSYVGMGFAIPINTAKMVIKEIMQFGYVRNVWTGLEVRELTSEIVQALKLPVNSGLFVERIEEDSPASQAGIQVGDIIVAVDGRSIRTVNEANREIFGLRVGDVLNMLIRRGNDKIELNVTLAERPKRI